MKIRLQLILTVITVFVLVGCIEGRQEIGPEVKKTDTGPNSGGTAITEISADQDGFNGKEVIVSGKVMPGLAFEFISEQPYRIIQGESLLWVITDDIGVIIPMNAPIRSVDSLRQGWRMTQDSYWLFSKLIQLRGFYGVPFPFSLCLFS